MNTLSRRRMLALMATAAGGPLLLDACSSTAASNPNELVVSTFPFGVDQFKQAIVEPFQQATGIKVTVKTGENSARLTQLQVAGGSPGIDVMLISDYYAALGQHKGLFQQVDGSKLANLGQVAAFAKDAAYSGPAYTYQLNGTLYATKALRPEDAANWSLYGNPEYSKKLALPNMSVTAGQLVLSGVSAAFGSGPYDIPTGMATLAKWAPGILQFYSSSTELTNLLTQGEVVAGDALNAFAVNVAGPGKPIAWTPPATARFMATNRAMIPQGAGNVSGALKFIDHLLSADGQTAQARLVGDLPVNTTATVPATLTDIVGSIVTDPVAAGYQTLDPAQIVPNFDTWVRQFNQQVAGK